MKNGQDSVTWENPGYVTQCKSLVLEDMVLSLSASGQWDARYVIKNYDRRDNRQWLGKAFLSFDEAVPLEISNGGDGYIVPSTKHQAPSTKHQAKKD